MPRENEIADAIMYAKTRFATDPHDWKVRIERFLASLPDSTDAPIVSDMRLPPSTVGASSGTLLFTARYPASKRAERLVLRFHPGTSHAHEYDMLGQYTILRALESTPVPAPRVLGVDASGEVLGVPGFLMQQIDGVALPSTYATAGPLFEADPAGRRRMVEQVLAALAEIHRVDWRSLQIETATRRGQGQTAFEKDLNWYRVAMRWGVPEEEPKLEPVITWLLEHQFEPKRLTLCHGDSSFPNYMFKDGQLVGVLDWEFAFIGAPEMDLAFQTVAHEILTLGQQPLAGVPAVAERRALYEAISGHRLDSWDYYFTWACMRAYIHMALTYRGTPPEMQAARERYLGLPFNLMLQSWEAARR